MIVDRIKHAAEYEDRLPGLVRALEEIQSASAWDGPCRFPGGYVMRQSGMTKPEDTDAFEAHRRYVDVFILAEGRETVLWNRLEEMESSGPYDPEKDKQPLRGQGSALEMRPGMFCALFPSDAHSACRHTEGQPPAAYVKYVVKLEA
jgi:YhcH/YjgK/YiaL family protein